MRKIQGNCIYCAAPVDLSRGDGDHVIPAAFGDFSGKLIFRRVCAACNSIISRAEEQVIRCGPESLYRRAVNPGIERNRRGTGWSGAHGMPAPRFTIDHGSHKELVDVRESSPWDVSLIDQLVLIHNDGTESYLRLSPKMTLNSLKKKISSFGNREIRMTYMHAMDDAWSIYERLLQQIWPDCAFVKSAKREPGVHRAQGHVILNFHSDYWRAIAKVGFHYYLLSSRRGLSGAEPAFEGIRRFIMEGGDHAIFFGSTKCQIRMPFGLLPDGRVLAPDDWMHILAADDSSADPVAMVCLFMGPRRIAPSVHINLGTLTPRIFIPRAQSCHAYVYNQSPTEGADAGRVVSVPLYQIA